MSQELPGLFDLQVNGFAGVDYNHGDTPAEELHKSFTVMRTTGVVGCLPTIITSSTEHFARCARSIIASGNKLVAGLHMEGPYISPVDGPRGAHDLAHVCEASIEDFKRRQDSAEGQIRLVTLAPEVPGALELTAYLAGEGIAIGIGHSAANDRQIADAVSAGATHSTHLGNGCFSRMDRHHNSLWPQLASDALIPGLIVDGHHLTRAFVQSVIKAKTPRRSVLVTDAVAAAAAPPGRYALADWEVERAASGKVTAVGGGHLAGSSLTLDDAVARTCQWTGLDFETVWAMGSTQPAAVVGLTVTETITVDWNTETSALKIVNP
ncbi:MAG: N-acetylglucosamine-6-phosphate deacetylase [Synoicihabitans sp.]